MDHGAKAVQTVYNLFEQNPGREFCDVGTAYKAGVLARVHDNSSILKDVVKIDTNIGENDHRKFRDQSWKIYGLKKLELVRPIAQQARHDRPSTRLQMADSTAGAHEHHRHVPE